MAHSNVTMVLGGSTGHSEHYGPSSRMALRHQHSLKWWPRPQVSAWSMITRAMNIKTDPGCCRATDSGMALSNGPGLDTTMAPHVRAGHSDQPGMDAACLLGTNAVSTVAQTPGVCMTFSGNRNHSICGSAMDPDMALGISLSRTTAWPQMAVWTIHLSLFLAAFAPSFTSLSTACRQPFLSPSIFTLAASPPASPGYTVRA